MRAVRLVVVACLLSGTSCQVTPNGDPAAKGSCAVVEDPPGVFTMTCPNGGSATWSEGTEGTAGAPGTDGAIGEAGTPGAPGSPGAPGQAGASGPAGPEGTAGAVSRMRIVTEPPGQACPDGGVRVDAGVDANGDGVLGDEEVQASTHLCHGSAGPQGQAGDAGAQGGLGPAGLSALVDIGDEPPGEHCERGGVVVRTGVDDDGDGVLDDEEVDHTAYLCRDPELTHDGDLDGDGVTNSDDNCLFDPNDAQTDLDLDGRGDACDSDRDGDGDPNDTDCDPDDPARHAGAPEVLDEVDNDCDDDVDEGLCGNGVVDEGEDCDVGADVEGDGCSPQCMLGTRHSCDDLLRTHPDTASGLYTVDPDGLGGDPSVEVYCDMDAAGGGWMLVAALTNRWARLAAPAPFFTVSLVQQLDGWVQTADNPVTSPAARGVLKVDDWPAPDAIRYVLIDTDNGQVVNEMTFDDAASIFHLRQYEPLRHERAGSALAHASRPAVEDRTVYYGSDHEFAWGYDSTFGRERSAAQPGWQFGVSVNFPDNQVGYDGVHDDHGRTEYNLGVAGYVPHAGDISTWWPGLCEADCGEDFAVGLQAARAVVQVWHRTEGGDEGPDGSPGRPAGSCKAIHDAHPALPSGIYWLAIGERAPFTVYCDMVTDGGGWTVLARYDVSEGPDVFAGSSLHDLAPWDADRGLLLSSGTHEHDIDKFQLPGLLDGNAEVSLVAGDQQAVFTDFTLNRPAVVHTHADIRRLAYASMRMDGTEYLIMNHCRGACCGEHTSAWDVPLVLANFLVDHPDVSGNDGRNAPAYGWVDPSCGDAPMGHEVVPGWATTYRPDEIPADERFAADLVFMFREADAL